MKASSRQFLSRKSGELRGSQRADPCEVLTTVDRAVVTRERAAKRFLSELIDIVYDGSAMSLVLHILAGGKASPQEVEEARKLLDQMEVRS